MVVSHNIHHPPPHAIKNFRKNIFNMIEKCITRPVDQTICKYSCLDEEACKLVQFYWTRFGVGDNGGINELFIKLLPPIMPYQA